MRIVREVVDGWVGMLGSANVRRKVHRRGLRMANNHRNRKATRRAGPQCGISLKKKAQVAFFRSVSLRIVATAEFLISVIIRHWGFDHPEVFRAQSSDPFPSPPLRPFSHSQNGGGPLERIRGARQGKGRVKRHPAHSTALSPTMRSNAQILVMGGGEAWLIRAHLRPAILPVENRPRTVVLRCRTLWRLGRCVNCPLRNAQPARASWCTPVAAHRVRSCLIMPARRTESCQLAEQIRANSPKNSFCCTISQGHTNFRREGRR